MNKNSLKVLFFLFLNKINITEFKLQNLITNISQKMDKLNNI